MTHFLAPVSPGELLDKITILEIKSERIEDPDKLSNVRRELAALEDVWSDSAPDDSALVQFRSRLKTINESLWEIEDHIREEERLGQFGARFIELARAVYATNDRRSRIKREVDLHLGSEFVGEKSYLGPSVEDHGDSVSRPPESS